MNTTTHRGRTPGPRAAQMQEIAQDVRLHSRAMHTRAALIAEVMARYGVTYGNARVMICRARKAKSRTKLLVDAI